MVPEEVVSNDQKVGKRWWEVRPDWGMGIVLWPSLGCDPEPPLLFYLFPKIFSGIRVQPDY